MKSRIIDQATGVPYAVDMYLWSSVAYQRVLGSADSTSRGVTISETVMIEKVLTKRRLLAPRAKRKD